MKTMILTTLMMLTVSTVHASKNCASTTNTIVLLSTAAGAIETKVAEEYREVVDRSKTENAQLNAIGVVKIPNAEGYGTGFMVSPCHVLTNAHVAFVNPLEGKNGQKVQFSVGQSSNKNQQFSEQDIDGEVVAHGQVSGEFVKETQKFFIDEKTVNSDWAVIKLRKNVGAQVGRIPFAQVDVKNLGNLSVSTAGFPGDRTKNGEDFSEIFADKKCTILGYNGDGGHIHHNCQTASGQSGSPLLAYNSKDKKYYAVGMVSGNKKFGVAHTSDVNKSGVAVKFSSGKKIGVITSGDEILQAIQNNKCD